jgi:preprotein translocase subunit SecY
VLDTLRSAWKVTDLRKKVIFTLVMFLVFRIGVHVPVPGIDVEAMKQATQGQLFGIFDVISGGAFRRLSVFAMSITPYINASIIMSLLQVVIPKLEQLAKEGEAGRKIIAQYTRYFAVFLGLVQAIGMSVALGRQGIFVSPGIGSYALVD